MSLKNLEKSFEMSEKRQELKSYVTTSVGIPRTTSSFSQEYVKSYTAQCEEQSVEQKIGCPRISYSGTRREHVCGKEKYKGGVCYYHWKKSPAGNSLKPGKNYTK